MGAFTGTPLAGRGIRPSSEVYYNQANGGQGQGNADEMDKAAQQWLADIDQYEATLSEMATATLDQDFKDELSAIEQWFRVLSEAERTSALYALIQQTTQVQIRFFIQVLQEMAKNHPMSGILSPANYGQKGRPIFSPLDGGVPLTSIDPMSQKFSDAMSKLGVEGSTRNSMGRPPPSPGVKRNSGLDPSVINSMFPDAAAAIAKQKEQFTQQTGMAPPSTRNSVVSDRASLVAPTISAPAEDAKKENLPQPPASPWGQRGPDGEPIARPKSSSGQQQPMGQFTAPQAGLRSPRPPQLSGDTNLQSTTLSAPENANLTTLLSPYQGSGNWASMVNTPMVPNFQGGQNAREAEMVANATAMKLAALSTVNNRIQFDDVRKFRRSRSSEGNRNGATSPGMPPASFIMTNEHGHTLTPQQAAALQAQQLAALNGRRSRPNSPGVMVTGAGPGGFGAMNFAVPQNNAFLSAYDTTTAGIANLNLAQFGIGIPAATGHEGYLSDHDHHQRGRSPRGRRGSSKPPEDPTDPSLLSDIPAWLRSLRLHKYTDNLKDLKWQDLVELDDDALEKRGVNALGARRKMLKVRLTALKLGFKEYLLTAIFSGLRASQGGSQRRQSLASHFGTYHNRVQIEQVLASWLKWSTL